MKFCRFRRLALEILMVGLFALQIGCGGSSSPAAPAGAAATLNVSSITFPSMVAGATATAQTVTLTNSGGATLTISGITITGTNASSFSQTNTCGTTVAASASCSITVNFVAVSAGSYSATLAIANNSSTPSATVALSGVVAAPTMSLSASSLTFPLMVAGATSTPQSVTLTNTGTVPVTLGTISIGGANATAFSKTTTCGTTLAVSATCTVTLSYAETATASDVATLSIVNNTATTPVTVALAGSAAVPTMSISPTSLTFPLTVAGAASTPQVVTLTNTGTVPVTLGTMSFSGASLSSYTDTTTCGTTIAVSGNCTVSVSFAPTSGGTNSATLTIANNTSAGSATVAVTGTATVAPAITLSSSTLTFTTPAESTSATQTVTLKNTGTAALVISTDTLSGANKADFNLTADTCAGTTVSVGSTCTITVSLTAYLATSYTGTISIASNAASSPNAITLTGTGTGTLSINTSNPTQWIISNGAITLQWDSTNATANIYSINLAGDSTQLIDTTVYFKGGEPYGLYEDDSGPTTGGTTAANYSQVGNEYIDWWQTSASNATGQDFTVTRHYLITANDPGFHVYNTTAHGASDVAAGLGTLGKTFRINQQLFTNSYSVDEDLTHLGVQEVPLPSPTVMSAAGADSGRAVENAVTDLHGLSLPSGFTRFFDTKYDYSTEAYLHKAHGLYGSKYGAWLVLPNGDWRAGGPTKQSLCFTYNILSQEFFTTHLDNGITYNMAAGQVFSKLWGPNYYHFNTFNSTITTPDQMYADAQAWVPWFNELYDNDPQLINSGQVLSTARGSVQTAITNGGSATPNTAWTVLSDNATNFQYSAYGRDYWVNQNSTGTAALTGVVPGTYRLSSYVLGQWGELRQDNVVVTANQTTNVSGTFTPENFGTAAPIWTIGTPNRSASKFLHGTDSNGNSYRNNYGAYNFWQDFASTQGTQIYYATAVGSTPASNNLNLINYNQWGTFDPGLYAGIYNASDDTTDGYNYIIPSYVASLTGATGTNGTLTPVPPLTIHFTTTAAQQAQGQYAVFSVGLACAESDIFADLNGIQQLIWHSTNISDCMMRSSFTGYYQWVVFQWPTSDLSAPGADNLLTLSTTGWGNSWDAFRMEITNQSAAPATTNWNDYEFVTHNSNIRANDTVPNN